jgi:hypothetical protein
MSIVGSAQFQDSLSTQDLALFLQYTTSTSVSMFPGPNQRLWQEIMPRYASRYMFVAHGVLSLAALHLSTLAEGIPEEATYYRALGRHHLSCIAVKLEEALRATCIPDDLVEATRCVVILTGCLNLACLTDVVKKDDSVLRNIAEQLSNSRIVNSAIFKRFPALLTVADHSSVSAEMLDERGDWFEGIWPHPNLELAYEVFEKFVQDREVPLDMSDEYLIAVRHLQGCLSQQRLAVILSWPVLLSDSFYNALTTEEPPAVVLLSLYGTILSSMEGVWCAKRAGQLILQAACCCPLPPEWRVLLNQICASQTI